MRRETRRRFLERSLGAAAAWRLGLAESVASPIGAIQARQGLPRSRALARGKLLGRVPFVEEGDFPLGTSVGSGLGGRLAFDLSTLTADALVTPSEKFFIRTRCPDQLRFGGSWRIAVGGLVRTPMELDLQELAPHAVPMGIHLLECAGNVREAHYGFMSTAEWTGIPISEVLLTRIGILPGATRVLIEGFDSHSRPDPDSAAGASWIFTLQDLRDSNAFLATGMNGAPLSQDHGYPVRLVVPGWYGCACIKWVNEIVLVDEEVPATAQMMEFAGRTHQDSIGPFSLSSPRVSRRSFQPVFARDFKPATIDLAAAPIRVERWLVDGRTVLRVAGILWGGDRLIKDLVIRFNPEMSFEPVEDFEHRTNASWNLWAHTFRPSAPGRYRIQLAVADKSIRTRRLDKGYYERSIDVTES